MNVAELWLVAAWILPHKRKFWSSSEVAEGAEAERKRLGAVARSRHFEPIFVTSWYGRYPIAYKAVYIPGGAGFLPSTVGGGFKYYFIFTLTWGNDPNWVIFFRWVESATYILIFHVISVKYPKAPLESQK